MDDLYFILDNIEINSYSYKNQDIGKLHKNYPQLVELELSSREWNNLVTISIDGNILSHALLHIHDDILHIVDLSENVGKIIVDTVETIALLENVSVVKINTGNNDDVFLRSGYKKNESSLYKKLKHPSTICGIHIHRNSNVKSILKKKKVSFMD